jgi:orotate phosphoribosyltransferase
LDDVATTGSTLLEAADALEAACAPGGIVSLVAARGGLVEGPQSPSHATVAAFGTPVLESQAWQIGEKPPGSAV